MGYNDIFYEYDEKYRELNQMKFKKFLEVFSDETGVDATLLFANEGIALNDYVTRFYYLKHIVYMYKPQLIKTFYQLLDELGYDLSSEIIDAMRLIGREVTYSIDETLKEYILRSPYIHSITNDKGKISIYSDDFGDYTITSTKKYFENNLPIFNLIKKYVTANRCHQMSWEVMKYLNDASIITALLPSYFLGTYYHTVIRNEDGMIVDIANDVVYDDETRDFLFKSDIICETHKDNLETSLEKAVMAKDEQAQQFNYPSALLLALHHQSKRL